MGNITAANSVYTLSIVPVFPVPQQLQGYATDAAWDTDATQNAEAQIGVDGLLSAGFVPALTNQTIRLQADSSSIALFEAWAAAQRASKNIFYAIGNISLPSVSRAYVCQRGVLMSYASMPGVGKVLKPRDFTITWQSIEPVPYGA